MKLGTDVPSTEATLFQMGNQPSASKRRHSPQFSAHVRCGQTAGWIKMPLGMEVGLGPGDFVLDGDPAPLKGAQSPISGPCLLWPNGWMDEAGTWHGGRPQPRRLCVRRGPRSTLRKMGAEPPPQFSAHFYCDHTAACIKMPFGTKVGLSPGDFVLDGDPAPKPLNFRPMFIIVIVISLE